MVSKLQLNPWNSHDCLEELREVGDAGNISTGRGNNWKMGFCSCFYCRVIMRSGIYTTAFKHDNSDNSCTGLQSATEGGLTSVIFLFYPWAIALPTRQQELIWILFDKYWTKLSRGFFLFFQSKTFKLTRQEDLILPSLSLDSVFPHCKQECSSLSCHSNAPGADQAAWDDTGGNNLSWVTWQVIFPS